MRSIGADGAGNVPDSIGRWRVEVKPGSARTEDCFLHLLQASDRTVEKMVESQVRENGSHIELVFTAGTRTYTFALKRSGGVGGHIRIVEGGKMLADRALAQEVMPQAGLALME